MVDLDILLRMSRYAKELGIKFMEKVAVVDLLKDGDRVVGAIGFSLLDGTTYLYKAKAVILANGCQNYRIMRLWSSGRGDGIAAAYRAGAKMRNAEFGSFVNMVHVETKMVSYGAEDCLYNSKGERVGTRAQLVEGLKTVVGGADIGGHDVLYMYWEVQKGNGPIYQNTAENHAFWLAGRRTDRLATAWLKGSSGDALSNRIARSTGPWCYQGAFPADARGIIVAGRRAAEGTSARQVRVRVGEQDSLGRNSLLSKRGTNEWRLGKTKTAGRTLIGS